MKYIKEADIYRLVMRSKLPDAEKFQDWVCEVVLPQIRKTGGYFYVIQHNNRNKSCFYLDRRRKVSIFAAIITHQP